MFIGAAPEIPKPMAQAVVEGAKHAGAEAELFTAAEFDGGKMDEFDAVAFGCPAMGAEELEDGEFAPMFETCESKLSGKKIALFGSYGWGDGEWMRTWEEKLPGQGREPGLRQRDLPGDPGRRSAERLPQSGRSAGVEPE